MSTPRTEVSVQLMMQFREKVVAAYQQLMQMQV
jgi:flagellar hook-basal body complex protein FliE